MPDLTPDEVLREALRKALYVGLALPSGVLEHGVCGSSLAQARACLPEFNEMAAARASRGEARRGRKERTIGGE